MYLLFCFLFLGNLVLRFSLFNINRKSWLINLICCFFQTPASARQRKSWDNEDTVKAIRRLCNKKWAIFQFPTNVTFFVLYCVSVYTQTWTLLKESNNWANYSSRMQSQIHSQSSEKRQAKIGSNILWSDRVTSCLDVTPPQYPLPEAESWRIQQARMCEGWEEQIYMWLLSVEQSQYNTRKKVWSSVG
jgi:hypothetical protein